MSLIYLSSSSPIAESFSMRIASQCESFLGSGCVLSNCSKNFSKQKIRSENEGIKKEKSNQNKIVRLLHKH